MKVALLLPGFVRDLSYLNALNVFLNNHKSYDFDLYTSSYDIVGLPTKSSINHTKYKTTESFVEHNYISKFKKCELDDYESYSKECLQFVNKNKLSSFIQKCSNEFWKKYNAKFKIKETEETLLANIFAQWNKVYKTYCLLDDPDSYDIIIRSRYDYNLKTMDLSKYINFCDQDKKTIVHKITLLTNQPKLVGGDNIKIFPVDGFAMGNPYTMKIYCSFGKPENFIRNIKDQNLKSIDWFQGKGKDIKLSNEGSLSYWCHNVNGLDYANISDNHLKKYPNMRTTKV